jgi:Zn-dependent protease with chaperone function
MVPVIAWTSVAATAPAGETQTPQQRPQAEVVVPPPTARALDYYRSGNVVWVMGTILGLAIPALLLFSGVSARLRTTAFRIGRRWLPGLALYAVLVTVLTALLSLPLAFYRGFVRQHAYGLSNQSLGKWAGDWLLEVGVSALGLALVLWIPYLLLRRSPKRWWLYAGLATAPIAAFVLLISPIWVDPLFNHFGPMRDQALEARILRLAARAGIPESRVYEVRKSVDTRTVNAYVTGFGGTKRIVLWDTLLEKLSPEEIEFVMAHEMGHFVLRHVLTLIVAATLLAMASSYVIHRVAGWIIRRHARSFGFERLSDPASFPLLLLLGTLVSLVATPLVLALSRHLEHEADRFALELTRNNRAAGTAFVRLQQENLAVPRPGALYRLWRGSHPSLGERVDFANRYRPWATGEPLRYERLIR